MDLFAELLQQKEYLTVAAVLALSAVFNLAKIANFYKSIRERRSVSISNAIADPGVSSELKAHFQNELNIEHFRNIHGVKLGLPMLKTALILNERVGKSVSFRHVIKTVKLVPNIIDINLPSYRVKISIIDLLFGIYNLLFGLIIFMYGLLVFPFSMVSLFGELQFILLTTSGLSLVLGFFMLNEGSALISVRHINKALEAFEEKSAQPDQ
ncbi:conserved hypothetical protein [Vibrio nigripulchritudo SFn27]|uniref:Uncharacterized protein n=1 Tax=Vibrio nigripulchritudo TaxID=28173 RepID=U4KB40_9VIBR|nr:hypothetical protein [Vibrio nigripulchritudo]CCN84632.1 conserved hypothetical protein [Vibrio nigripulchritudo BLFn1]CCN90915.1 conserved hypothetical protein [Vibrio nigripulchritudo SFn27]CCN96153.1 conserved hypothetical protein [Vibrio nigripulchritudo ENn2]CCO41196.1 conserved hypothetical protein [Vibrio nigripulchritudo SFn135]CCO54534.1 conserved hypothetical protein [Vibrio nigripulchritudo Wn13]